MEVLDTQTGDLNNLKSYKLTQQWSELAWGKMDVQSSWPDSGCNPHASFHAGTTLPTSCYCRCVNETSPLAWWPCWLTGIARHDVRCDEWLTVFYWHMFWSRSWIGKNKTHCSSFWTPCRKCHAVAAGHVALLQAARVVCWDFDDRKHRSLKAPWRISSGNGPKRKELTWQGYWTSGPLTFLLPWSTVPIVLMGSP